MEKNQSIRKKLSLLGKTLDLSYRLSPTKPQQSPNLNQSSSSLDQSDQHNQSADDHANNNLTNSANKDSLGERVFKDFTATFEKDGNIIEFDIIKQEEALYNKSPIRLDDHHIALESWAVKPVYKYLYKQLISHNKKETLLLNDEELIQKTRMFLLLNSDVLFVWNIRKTLVEDGRLSIEEDLKFSKLALKHKPKCQDNFMHRQWLLMHLAKKEQLTNQILNEELEVCRKAADQYTSNYHAWNHRFYIVDKFFNTDLNFLLEENDRNKKWINNHISDYSGYHYKQLILSIIFNHLIKLNKKEEIVKLLNCEKMNLKKLVQIYPCREALFCHKRYLLKLKHLHLGLNKEDIIEEEEFVKRSYDSAKKFENNWLIILTNRYVKWLEYNCKIQICVK